MLCIWFSSFSSNISTKLRAESFSVRLLCCGFFHSDCQPQQEYCNVHHHLWNECFSLSRRCYLLHRWFITYTKCTGSTFSTILSHLLQSLLFACFLVAVPTPCPWHICFYIPHRNTFHKSLKNDLLISAELLHKLSNANIFQRNKKTRS